jgi:hypothetical protein
MELNLAINDECLRQKPLNKISPEMGLLKNKLYRILQEDRYTMMWRVHDVTEDTYTATPAKRRAS